MPSRTNKHYISVPIHHRLTESRTASSTAIEQLNQQLIDAYNKIKLTDQEIEIRNSTFQRYKQLIESNLDCRVEPFGSHHTTLFVRTSDIDITLISSSFSSISACNDTKSLANNILSKITNLINNSDMANSIIHIKKAKTPIIKCIDKISGCKLDISINQQDGIETAEFISKILEAKPYIRYMAILLKYFLKRRRLGDTSTGGLCSYAQFIMILHFLEIHPVIQQNDIEISSNLGVLFMDLFQFYGVDFPFERTKVSAGCLKYQRNESKGIYVADPIIHGNNVAAGCTMIGFVKDVFQYSYRIMNAALAQKISCKKAIIELWLRIK